MVLKYRVRSVSSTSQMISLLYTGTSELIIQHPENKEIQLSYLLGSIVPLFFELMINLVLRKLCRVCIYRQCHLLAKFSNPAGSCVSLQKFKTLHMTLSLSSYICHSYQSLIIALPDFCLLDLIDVTQDGISNLLKLLFFLMLVLRKELVIN